MKRFYLILSLFLLLSVNPVYGVVEKIGTFTLPKVYRDEYTIEPTNGSITAGSEIEVTIKNHGEEIDITEITYTADENLHISVRDNKFVINGTKTGVWSVYWKNIWEDIIGSTTIQIMPTPRVRYEIIPSSFYYGEFLPYILSAYDTYDNLILDESVADVEYPIEKMVIQDNKILPCTEGTITFYVNDFPITIYSNYSFPLPVLTTIESLDYYDNQIVTAIRCENSVENVIYTLPDEMIADLSSEDVVKQQIAQTLICKRLLYEIWKWESKIKTKEFIENNLFPTLKQLMNRN